MVINVVVVAIITINIVLHDVKLKMIIVMMIYEPYDKVNAIENHKIMSISQYTRALLHHH